MTFLLVFVSLDPELTSFFLVGDDFVQRLDTIVQLCLCQLKCFINADFLGLEGRLSIHQLIDSFVKLFDLALSLFEQVMI